MRCWKWIRNVVLVFFIAGLISCGGGEAKRDKFLEQGQAHYQAGDYTTARLDAKNALQIDPKHAPGYLLLGKTELKLENFKAAFSAFSSAIKFDPENTAAQLAVGQLLLVGGQPEKAIEKAELILARNGEHVDAKVLKASALLGGGKPGEAVALLHNIAQSGLKNPQAFQVLAMALLQQKNVDEARQVLTRGIEANPDAVDLLLMLAQVESESKHFDAAVLHMKKAIELQPDDAMLPYQLANLYWTFQRVDQARAIVREYLAQHARKEDAYILAAGFFEGKHVMQESEDVLRQGIVNIPDSFKLRFALSDILVKEEKVDQAFSLLKECLGLAQDPGHPDIITTRLALAHLNLLVHEIPAARAEVEQVLQVSPKNTEGLFLKGQVLIAEGNASEAVPQFRVVISEKPSFLPAYLQLARAHVLAKQPEMAKDVLGKALEAQPDAPDILRAMAILRAQDKDYSGAENALRRILQATPGDIQTRAQLGDVLMSANEFARAEMEYGRLVQEQGQNPIGYVRLARLYAKQNQGPAAEKILRQGYDGNPDSGVLFMALVQMLERNGQFDAAEALCRENCARRPDQALGHTMLGQVLTHKKQYAEAEAALRQAIAVAPAWQTPYTLLASLYVMQGKQAEAIKEFEGLRDANPDNIHAYFSLALLYEKNGDKAKAATAYRELLAKQPDLWSAANNLAFLLGNEASDTATLDEALTLAVQANRLHPGDSSVLDTLGWVRFRRGEFAQALALLEESLARNPDSPEVNYHAAAVLHACGRTEEAREKLARALQEDAFAGRAEAEKLNKLIGQ